MLKKIITVLLSVIIFLPPLEAQEIDSSQVRKLLKLESTIDSLRQQIRTMDGEIQRLKANLAGGNHLDELLSAFNEEDVESAPEEQRSRRKRVDALLRAIAERPGQLRFNGGADNSGKYRSRQSFRRGRRLVRYLCPHQLRTPHPAVYRSRSHRRQRPGRLSRNILAFER